MYRPIGESIKEGWRSPNYYLIGVEMCVNSDGDWSKTYNNTVELVQFLLNKYQLTINELYRHYDITGKLCPQMMIDEEPWQQFITKVNNGLKFKLAQTVKVGIVNTKDLNIRTGNGVTYKTVGQLKEGDKVRIYQKVDKWLRIGKQLWVHGDYIKVLEHERAGKVVVSDFLNVRKGPGTKFDVVDQLLDGTLVKIQDKKDKWLRIGSTDEGDEKWIHGNYVNDVEVENGRVKVSDFLNVRQGPGTNFDKTRELQPNALIKVYEKFGKWLKVDNKEWVHGGYVEILD